MQRTSGFTLIEVMIVMAILAILTAVAYPSYRDYIQRGIRSQGQQYLMDLAQRQEQYFLDARSYATTIDTTGTAPAAAGQISVAMPLKAAGNYTLVVAACAAPCVTFRFTLTPIAGSTMFPSGAASDGSLIINNTMQRWREVDGSGTYGTNDCLWEATRCTPK